MPILDPETQKQLTAVLTKALTGAALGGTALGGATYLGGDKEDPERGNKALKAMLLGGGMGGLVGGGMGAFDKLTPENKSPFTERYDQARALASSPKLIGGGIGGTLGGLSTWWKNKGIDKAFEKLKEKAPWELTGGDQKVERNIDFDPTKQKLKATQTTSGNPPDIKPTAGLDQAIKSGRGFFGGLFGRQGLTNPRVAETIHGMVQKAPLPEGMTLEQALNKTFRKPVLEEIPLSEKWKQFPGLKRLGLQPRNMGAMMQLPNLPGSFTLGGPTGTMAKNVGVSAAIGTLINKAIETNLNRNVPTFQNFINRQGK